jgi:hypothetical protein
MSVQADFDMVAFERAVTQTATRPEVVLEFLSEEIEWTEIDHVTPPSSPRRLRGHAEVLEMLRGMADRGIETALVDSLLTGDRAALKIRCRYPDGRIVLEHALVAVRDGRFDGWQGVQAWDEETHSGIEAFATRVLGDLAATMTTVLAMLGDRLGLFPALAQAAPVTSAELADRAGANERYTGERWIATVPGLRERLRPRSVTLGDRRARVRQSTRDVPFSRVGSGPKSWGQFAWCGSVDQQNHNPGPRQDPCERSFER